MFRLFSILSILFALSLPVYYVSTGVETKPKPVRYGPDPMCGKKSYGWCY